jgi:hypothetical protein
MVASRGQNAQFITSHLFLAVVACNEKYRTYNSKKREVSYKNMKSQSAYIRVHWTNYLVTPTQSVFYYDTNSLLISNATCTSEAATAFTSYTCVC